MRTVSHESTVNENLDPMENVIGLYLILHTHAHTYTQTQTLARTKRSSQIYTKLASN